MKQNKYDDERFFEKYAQMDRSQGGLKAAGEWQSLQALLPDFAGKQVLDLGCGYGWHCEYAAAHDAAKVIGLDLSEKMLEIARQSHSAPQIQYDRVAMEDAAFAPDSFDVVLSSLALHYVPSFGEIAQRVFSWLRPEGDFVFSCEHPIFTAQGSQQWQYDEKGNIACFPVDRYFEEGERQANFLGETVTKYHRTLTTLVQSLLKTGFIITGLVEPQPTEEMLSAIPAMADELRRPMMLIISAKKPK